MQDDFRSADLVAPTRALLEVCQRLTLTPWKMGLSDVARLREHGFDDEAIHDAIQIAAYFSYINRVCDGLGIELEDFMAEKPADWDRQR